jgi:16S rRNA processing protein RimM
VLAYLPIGKIVGVHGIRGNLKLHYFSGLRAFPYEKIYLKETDGTYSCYKIISVIILKGTFAVHLEGIETRNAAEYFVGREVFYPEEALPLPEKGEYYWKDLLGMTVVAPEVTSAGIIEKIVETGAADVLEININGREILIPFSSRWIDRVQIDERQLILKKGVLEFFDVY